MLGRRAPQRSLFDAQALPHRVPIDSFYGRMAAISDVLFDDADLSEMYCPDNGRPSLPPALLSGVLLLQFYDDAADGEAVNRLLFDLRWKVALGLPLDYQGFDPSSLVYFRRRLLEHGRERYAFDRFIAVGRAAGFIPDKVTLLTDTTPVKGAGAVQDTYTLIRKAIRKLLKDLGYRLAGKRRGLSAATKALVDTYLAQDQKAAIDWADPAQRSGQLQQLVADAEAVLELAAADSADADVRISGWLLTKILGDDVVPDAETGPQIGQGTAPDRIISVTDPEMRHGRKSRSQLFNGYKVSVSTDLSSDMILDIADVSARGSDGQHLLPVIRRTEAETGVTVAQAMADGAYNSGENLAACAEYPPHPIDLITPGQRVADPAVHKTAFALDLEAQTATCPEGQTVAGKPRHDPKGRPTLLFQFDRGRCEQCPLFARCVRSKKHGRTVRTTAHEAHLQAQRQRQQEPAYQERYRLRSRDERKIAELVQHGLRETRYLGEPKRQLQRLWLGAAVNLKCLFRLAEEQGVNLRAVLQQIRPSWDGRPVMAGFAASG